MGDKVFFKPEVIDFLNQLITTFIFKEYFSYKENAVSYVADVVEEIMDSIEIKKQYKTPIALEHHEMYYITIHKSKRTTWYIFFDKKAEQYDIKYITNNHTAKTSFINQLK